MNWKRYLFDFDSHYRDQNLTVVYNQKRNKFLANEIFVKIANIKNKLVIGNLADYQKLNLHEKILMTLVQFRNGLFIRSGI